MKDKRKGAKDWSWSRTRGGADLIVGETKRCPRCSAMAGRHVYLPFADFQRDTRRPHGFSVYCRGCNKALQAKSALKNPAPAPAPVVGSTYDAEMIRLWSAFVLGKKGDRDEFVG